MAAISGNDPRRRTGLNQSGEIVIEVAAHAEPERCGVPTEEGREGAVEAGTAHSIACRDTERIWLTKG
jgi:hypothetical protein